MSAIKTVRDLSVKFGHAYIRSFQKDAQEKPVKTLLLLMWMGFQLGVACYHRAIKSQLPAD